ncbi:hypothetical protein [Fimbriiglobus ruber]|nr:hypothetical protein [Fimbriiglobus ruber]
MNANRERWSGRLEVWACGSFFALCALTLVGGNLAVGVAEHRAESQREQAARELEDELTTFGRAQIPTLQQLIDDLPGWIGQIDERCRRLADELTRLHRIPRRDPDYQTWKKQADELRVGLTAARSQREELYLEYRKAELAPAGKDAFLQRLAEVRQECDRTTEKFKQVVAEREKLGRE